MLRVIDPDAWFILVAERELRKQWGRFAKYLEQVTRFFVEHEERGDASPPERRMRSNSPR
jgi:hypothetical protein